MTSHDYKYVPQCPRPPAGSPRYDSNGQLTTFTYITAFKSYESSYEYSITETSGYTRRFLTQPRFENFHHPSSTTSNDGYGTREQIPRMHESPRGQPFGSLTRSFPRSTGVPPIETKNAPSITCHRSRQPTSFTVTEATGADARKHRIPAGYSLKNWDPSETPILLLGSAFDANSLGKWIYDWTVYHHGPATPISDIASELWLLLIQLAGKVKQAEEAVSLVHSSDDCDLVEDFIEAGKRLTENFRSLLQACEAPMLKASRRKQPGLGKNAGAEFVETLFGRDRELGKTERFMQNVRLFSIRFDNNCEEILKNLTR
ncbi:uncharacterized protein FMAN_15487 [Fusarium mangiferae]|uniref:Vegetative cell wall protein gp1 n=1 Tax=Fusarium mangiferae TaxID=192010 RepID=A0A1L7ULI1_FUSMA|nr:uncharacterized protein FMAN_15487 [Fusarium mangiferae]CVL09323.1 uncharacterized protein FMAN_15487 [Fusarium mangiferae]